MSLSPSTVTLSAFASTHIWDYRVCVQPTRRAPSHFAKRSPTKKLLLFNSLFSWMLLWNQTSVNVFFGCAPGFRHHDVIVWNCRNSRLVMSWRSITTISRWVPVVAGSRVTWNSIFYIFEFSFRVFCWQRYSICIRLRISLDLECLCGIWAITIMATHFF